ncbi:retrovirus polyprotein, putative [Anopheles sinensis]|uniref:Retrovirus polyprotein, putative n=1 Tax=Anopheles sinensis TaxID=74873 RepID=A0A084VSC2_ANOSI|nr:retrovirus polyprotein, putative [Anopheles sinensis]
MSGGQTGIGFTLNSGGGSVFVHAHRTTSTQGQVPPNECPNSSCDRKEHLAAAGNNPQRARVRTHTGVLHPTTPTGTELLWPKGRLSDLGRIVQRPISADIRAVPANGPSELIVSCAPKTPWLGIQSHERTRIKVGDHSVKFSRKYSTAS